MKPAIRKQTDDDQDVFSIASGLDFTDSIDTARQEFRDEANVNHLLSRYGVNIPLQREPQYGEVDFDLDLHSAYISVHRAQHAFNELPVALKTKYRTTEAMLDAMNSGELAKDLKAERDQGQQPAPAAAPLVTPTPEPTA